MGRILAAILALILGANGLVMLFAGLWWYGAVPGVTATGPYNPHFVRDIGAAYLVVSASLAAFAARPREAWPAVAAAAAFLGPCTPPSTSSTPSAGPSPSPTWSATSPASTCPPSSSAWIASPSANHSRPMKEKSPCSAPVLLHPLPRPLRARLGL